MASCIDQNDVGGSVGVRLTFTTAGTIKSVCSVSLSPQI